MLTLLLQINHILRSCYKSQPTNHNYKSQPTNHNLRSCYKSTTYSDVADTSIKTAGPEGNPFYNIYWLAKE